MRRTIVAALALGLAAGPVLLATPAIADPAPTTGTICGYAWNDLNGDGIRQADEPPVETNVGISGTDGHDTETDKNGHYCITGLTFGSYRLQFNDLLGWGFGWTKPGHDSRPDWRTGTTGLVNVGVGGAPAEVDNIDGGYLKGANDDYANRLGEDGREPIRVGEEFTIVGETGLTGNVPDQPFAEIALPAGLTVQKVFGDMTAGQAVGPHDVSATTYGRMVPGTRQTLGLVVKVTAPMRDATITFTVGHGMYGDTNPKDNVLTQTISALPAAPAGTTTAPPKTTTAHPTTTTSNPAIAVPTTSNGNGTGGGGPLPYTGVSLGVPIAAGSGLVAAGVAGFWFTRRRRPAA